MTRVTIKNPHTIKKAMARMEAELKRNLPKMLTMLACDGGSQFINPRGHHRSKLAWAVVAKGNIIDVETIALSKSDVSLTIYDEETGAKVRRVRVSLA